jgi:superfamily II DNA/RNA helicase
MLDMGFIDDIEAIAAATPENRQTLMFSATFAGDVGHLAQRLTHEAMHIEVASHTDSHDNIEQRLHLADTLGHKNDLLDRLLTDREVDQAVVFTSTQRDADVLANRLADLGHAVAALHGGMPQGRRNRVLQALRNRQLRVLVATDVAARGIDVPTITHVINYGMPMKAEDYVHRIGRTGRAGRSGLAVTLAERRDIPMVRRIERFTTQRIPEAVIEGLEPKFKTQADKGPRHAKPMPGQRRRDGFESRDRRESHAGGRPGHHEPRFERDEFAPRPQGPRHRDHDPRFEAPRAAARPQERHHDRAYHEPRQDDRRGDRPYGGDRAHGDRPFGKPAGRHAGPGFSNDRPGKPHGDRAFGDRPSFGDRPFNDRPRGERTYGDKPFGDKPFGRKPQGGHGFGDKAHGHAEGKSFGNKPFGGGKDFGGKDFGRKPGGFGKSGPHKSGGSAFGGKRNGGFGRREG